MMALDEHTTPKSLRIGKLDDVGRLGRFVCRKLVEDSFSMERMVKDHEEFYRSVLRTSAPDRDSSAYRPPSMASVA